MHLTAGRGFCDRYEESALRGTKGSSGADCLDKLDRDEQGTYGRLTERTTWDF